MLDLLLSSAGKIPEINTSLAAHIALTTGIHGAVSAPTASKLVIRDAAGRAQFASPSADSDAATKGWVNSVLPAGTVYSITAGTGLAGGTITGTGTISLGTIGGVAGSYDNPTMTVDGYGRITAIAAGSAPVLSVAAAGGNGISVGGTAQNPTVSLALATTSVSGAFDFNDKVKLNGIASGAQVNTITSVFGRTGAVVAAASDYRFNQLAGQTISASAPSGGNDGDVWFKV